jgi:hypothetical protein
MKSLIAILSMIFFFLYSNIGLSQITTPNPPLTKVTLIERCVSKSELIIEVHAITSNSFKAQNHNIYTAVIYKVLKTFKGNYTDSIIEVVYEGGSVDGQETMVTDYYEGLSGDEGILFLNTKSNISFNKNLQAYLPNTGITYNKFSRNARCIEIVFDDIEKEIFQPIEAATGQKRKVLNKNMFGF